MKKTIVSLASGILLTGFAFSTSASAEAEYEIQKGDSLSELAQEFGTTTEHLKEQNQLTSDLILAGDQLKIDNTKNVKVMKGDTLSELARDLQVDVEEVKEWNNLDSSLILVGQDIKIQLPADALKNFKEFKEERGNEEASSEATVIQQTQASSNEATEQEQANQATETERQAQQSQASEQTSEGNVEQASQTAEQSEQGETITVTATAYTADCTGCSGITATGVDLNADRDKKVIAVDPNVIPLGTRVYVEGYGEAIAADTGGAIKGNKIDVHVPTKAEAYEWGVKTVEVEILD